MIDIHENRTVVLLEIIILLPKKFRVVKEILKKCICFLFQILSSKLGHI